MRGYRSGMALLVALLVVVLAGCYEPTPPPPSAASAPETNSTEAPTPETTDSETTAPAAATTETTSLETTTADRGAAQPAPQSSEPAPTEAMSETAENTNADNESAANESAKNENVEKAQVGVGKRGRDYGGGIITEPARQRFLIADRLTFTAIDHAMNLYKATNGHLPKTHDEFMRDIVQANNLKLPDLPAGDEYFYDPERGELMVRHPQK